MQCKFRAKEPKENDRNYRSFVKDYRLRVAEVTRSLITDFTVVATRAPNVALANASNFLNFMICNLSNRDESRARIYKVIKLGHKMPNLFAYKMLIATIENLLRNFRGLF